MSTSSRMSTPARVAGSVTVLVALVLSASLSLAAHAGTCPSDTLRITPPGGLWLPSTPTDWVEYNRGGDPSTMATYDLTLGTLRASAYGYFPYMGSLGWTANALVTTRDVYTLVGPAGTGPLTFRARLRFTATSTGQRWYSCQSNDPCEVPSGEVRVRLLESASNMSPYQRKSDGTVQTELVIPVTRAPGETFELEMSAYANADFAGNS